MHVVAPDPIPAILEAIVSRLMEKLRENRYESAKQVVEAIDHAAAIKGITFLSAQRSRGGGVGTGLDGRSPFGIPRATLPFVAGPEADRWRAPHP